MNEEATFRTKTVSIGINRKTGGIQVAVPEGTSLVDTIKAFQKIDLSEIAKLPRGCQACLSGMPFDIREHFNPVINVRIG